MRIRGENVGRVCKGCGSGGFEGQRTGKRVDCVVDLVLDGALLLEWANGYGVRLRLGLGFMVGLCHALACWNAALSSSRLAPPAAASSDSTRALKPVFACEKFWDCAQLQGPYGARSKAIAHLGHELGAHIMPARVVGRGDRDGGVRELRALHSKGGLG